MTDLCCDKPSIGATVHYVDAGQFGEVRVPCLPAVVTDHYGDDLELTVIDHGDTFVAQANHDHGLSARTWHSASDVGRGADPVACDGFPYR
jgi:hypothetical protein